jgi:DNA-binding CsgD family transcriptional regulator/tetratricopeptide (TPR) repeat protein
MPTATPVLCPILVGRDALLTDADRRLLEASRGRGGLLLLAGEAGIGKTRLLGAIERRAASDRFEVARGVTFPRDIDVAGGVLLDLARSLGRLPRLAEAGAALEARLLAAEAGDDDETGDPHRKRRILELDVVDQLAALPSIAGRPVAISLEDLHWADDLSLEVVAGLARRLPTLPMLVVATMRSDELYPRVPMREWRSRLVSGRLADEARLGRLSEADTATMATLILGTGLPAPRDLVDSLLARSDGIPLHVEELLAVSGGSTVPESLEVAVLTRAERLSPETRSVADAAAVIGRSFGIPLLAAVTERTPEDLAPSLAELERAFIVVRADEPNHLDFRHALIRDALVAAIPAPTQRAIHGRVADAARASGRFSPAFVAIHLEEAGRGGEAFPNAIAGADRAAAVFAHREARDLLERAVRNAPASMPATERAALIVRLAREAAAIDANADADRWFAEAEAAYEAAGAPREAAALAPERVAVRHLLGDDLDARSARLLAAVAVVAAGPDDAQARRLRGRLLAGLAAATMLDRRLDQAVMYGTTARELAIAAGDEATERNAATSTGAALVFTGRLDDGWALIRGAMERSRAAGLEAEAARGYRMLGSCASVLVEYRDGERWLREGIEFADRVDLPNHRHYMAAHLAHVLWATGRLTEAEQLAAHALSDGRGGITTRITALHVLGYVALGRGELADATTRLEEARGLGERMHELQRLSPALWGLAEVARLRGDTAAAIEWCRQGEAASAAVDDAAYLYPFLVTGTRALLDRGDVAGAEAWADQVGADVAARGIPGTLPAIEHANGLVELARGTTGKARTSLEAAVEGWRARDRWWEGTWAAIDLATVHFRANRPDQATQLATEARDAAEAGGSVPLAAAAGSILTRARSRSRAEDPWAPLTAREAEVAQLVARGLTNGAIAEELGCAVKTVTTHVEHILAKLGASRRAEIAAWAAARNLAGRDRN